MTIKTVLLCILFFITSFSIQAKTYKCTDKAGKVSYGTSPCKEEQRENQINGGTISSIQFRGENGSTGSEAVSDYETQKLRNFYANQLQIEYSKPFVNTRLVKSLQESISDIDNRKAGVNNSEKQSAKRINDEMDEQILSEKAKLEADKSRLRGEMQNQKMQHDMEIHRMESQQRLRDQGILR